MANQVDTSDPQTIELAKRIIVRLTKQSEPEIAHVLSQLFPNSKALSLKSVAEDLAGDRINAEDEFMNLVKSSSVDMEVFNSLSSGDKDPDLIFSRSQYDPTKFELTLKCARTPFKEFFDECRDITCEQCIKGRITSFDTENKNSQNPWSLKVERVEKSRVDLCSGCGRMLNSKKDEINLQKERLLYKCSSCGHSGWNKAK